MPNDDPDLVVTYADRSVSPDNFYDDGGYEDDGKTSAKERQFMFERLPVRENASSVLMFCAGTLSIILGIWMQIEAVKSARSRPTYAFNTRAEEPPVLLSRAIPTVDGPHKPASPLTQLSQMLQLEAPRDDVTAISQDASRCLVESYPSLAAISTHVRVAPTYFLRGYAAQAWMRPPTVAKHTDAPVAVATAALSQAQIQLQPTAQAQAQAQPATEAAAAGKMSGVTSGQRPPSRSSASSSRDKVRKVLGRGSALPALGSSAASFSSSSGLYAEANPDVSFGYSETALDAGAGKRLLSQQGEEGISPRPGWSWRGQWSLGGAWSSAHPYSSSPRPVFVALTPLAIAPPKGSLQSLTLQLAAKSGSAVAPSVLAAPFSLLVSVQGQGAKAIQLYNSAFFGPYDRPASGPASASSLKAGPTDLVLERSVHDALALSLSSSSSHSSAATGGAGSGVGAADFFVEDPASKGAFIRHADLERRVFHGDQLSSSSPSSSSSSSSSSTSTKAEADTEAEVEALYESRALHAQQGLVEMIKLWAEIAAAALKVIHRARHAMRTYLKKLASFEVFVGAVLKRVGRAGAFSGEW